MKYLRRILLLSLLLSNISYADGLDDPKFYQNNEVNPYMEPKGSPNYYKHFNKHPCWYDDTLSCNLHEQDYEYFHKWDKKHKVIPINTIPEPSQLLLLLPTLIFLLSKKK